MIGVKGREQEVTATERSAVRTRKRFARRQWRRRWVWWRPILAVVLVLALVAGGVWLVYFSTVLTVQRVDVRGLDRLDEQQVLNAAQVPNGEQLARLDLAAITARVQALAPVRSADVTREWPDAVRIDVEERVAVAVVEIGGRLRGLDEEGVVFAEYAKPAQAPAGLPRVSPTSQTTPEALREAATVAAAMPPALAAMVDHLEVQTVDRVTLVLKDARVVLWGSADDSALKAQVLQKLLGQPGKVFDVSVPGQPTACAQATVAACLGAS